MNKQHRRMQAAANLCLELGEDDGIDPRYLARKSARKPSTRKAMQLCKEAARVFSLVLAGECRQRVLREVQVVSVVPEREGQLLLVTVVSLDENAGAEGELILAALKQVQGQLRFALARAINRKHTPELAFRYVGVLTEGKVDKIRREVSYAD